MRRSANDYEWADEVVRRWQRRAYRVQHQLGVALEAATSLGQLDYEKRTAAEAREQRLRAALERMKSKGVAHNHPEESFCLPMSCPGWWAVQVRAALATDPEMPVPMTPIVPAAELREGNHD